MRGRKPDPFQLKPKDRIDLQTLLRQGQLPLRVARRAQILLSRDRAQLSVGVLGQTVEQHPSTIWRVCERYTQDGLQAALYDAARPGRPPLFFQP